MSELNIEQVLNYQLNEFQTAYPIDIKYSNTEYEPVIGTNYISQVLIPNSNTQASIGPDSCNRLEGIYQLMLNIDSGIGKGTLIPIINNLKTYFKRGTSIIYNGIKVRVTKFAVTAFYEEEAWYRQVIEIEYRSDIEN